MFQKNKIAEIVRNYAEQVAKNFGCHVVSTSLHKEKNSYIIRVIVDGDNLSLDKCSEISTPVSRWLDENADNIPFDNYRLEISSPGPERVLISEDDFKRFVGYLVSINTKNKAFDGRRRYSGRIKSVNNNTLTLYIEKESVEFVLDIENISKARLEYEL